MLPCHKTHCSSSHHILLCLSLSLSLLLSGTWGGRCFSHFSLPSSTTEKAARVQLHLGPDMESLNSLKNECLNGIILVCVPSLFYVCSWTCEISEATENFITLSLPLSSAEHRFSECSPPCLESIGTENGGQGCSPPTLLLAAPGEQWSRAGAAFNQRDVWRQSMDLMTINACSYKFWLWMLSNPSPSTWGRHPNSYPSSLQSLHFLRPAQRKKWYIELLIACIAMLYLVN